MNKRRYTDPRGPLYRKMTFGEKYETEIIFFTGVFIIALLFLVALACVTPTVASVI